MSREAEQRYTRVAIALHWMTALAIVGLIGSGLWMVNAINNPATQRFAFEIYQHHKSLGITVLVLTAARLAWRVANPPPPLPAAMSRLERAAASTTHALFYGLLVGLPLAGWAIVSASKFGLPTMVYGLVEWPHISWLANLEDKVPAEAAAKVAHKYMGYVLMTLLALHVAAALKHHFVNRDGVLARMLPWSSARSRAPRI